MTDVDLRVQHNSMQFSDARAQQQHDAEAVFAFATKRKTLFVTGTESGAGGAHVLYDAITKYAKQYGFALNAHKWGDWVAVNLQLAKLVGTGFAGPFIEGTHGINAAHGAHSPRGIAWATADVPQIGIVTMGSVHYLTQRSIEVSGSNQPLADGIAAWGADKGQGKQLVLINGDVNMDDEKRDVFLGKPFTTVWDELKKYPATHGIDKTRGSTIDIAASYDADGRVKAKSARSLDDSDLQLFTDHFVIEATYSVRAV